MSGSAPQYRTRKLAYYRKTNKRTVGDDRVYTEEQREFMLAIDQYKRDNHRPHPTWAEVLAIAKALGYRKVQ